MTDVTWRVPDWPTQDQALWRRMTTQVGPLDEGGELTHLRESSIRNTEVAYGRWLAWLGKHESTALKEPPIPRVTPQRVRLWMDAERDRAPNSRKMWIDGLIRVLTAAEPDVQIPFLRVLQRNLLQLASDDHGVRKIGRIPELRNGSECPLSALQVGHAASERGDRANEANGRFVRMAVLRSFVPAT